MIFCDLYLARATRKKWWKEEKKDENMKKVLVFFFFSTIKLFLMKMIISNIKRMSCSKLVSTDTSLLILPPISSSP